MPLLLSLVACQGGDGSDPPEAAPADATPTVVLETTKGRIVMELDREQAPLSVANFLAHVQVGFYDSLTFHRVRPGFMIQAGKYTAQMAGRSSSAGAVPHEGRNGLKNLRGTVAMARLPDPHSATTQFFINLVDNANLDYDSATARWGYTVFGRVLEGMEVVDAIAAVPTRRHGRHEAVPVEPVIITRAYVADEAEGAPSGTR
jgi:cyclophilin family peptidyl-prolyl cis-trans isomerase